MKPLVFLLFSVIALLPLPQVQAQNTQIMIRAKAKDAKFVGSSIGGAQIFVKNAMTGEILAQGITYGSTGNTNLIMKHPHQRHHDLSDAKTAGFLAQLDLSQPTLLTIEAHSPLQAKQAQIVSSTQIWAIPEKDILGDGIVLEIPGFIIDILSPQRHQKRSAGEAFSLKANITMMCGCTISKDGLWNGDAYEVEALIYAANKLVKTAKLELENKVNTFIGRTSLPQGNYTVMVYAYDPVTGNTGVDKTNIIIQ